MMFHFQCFANFLQLPIELVVIKCIKALCIAWFMGQGSGGGGVQTRWNGVNIVDSAKHLPISCFL